MPSCRALFVFLLVLCGGLALAQSSKQDSITHRYDSLAKLKLNKADSSDSRINTKIDATQSKIDKLFNPDLNQLITRDKLQKKKQRRDSIQFHKKREAQRKVVRNKIDSLENIQQPFVSKESRLGLCGGIIFLTNHRRFLLLVEVELSPTRILR